MSHSPPAPRPLGQVQRPASTSGLSPTLARLLLLGKIVVSGYWLWVLVAALRPERDAFEALVVVSAPLLLSLHFVQGLALLRVLRGRDPWWRDFLLILFFGLLHLWPVLQRLRTTRRA